MFQPRVVQDDDDGGTRQEGRICETYVRASKNGAEERKNEAEQGNEGTVEVWCESKLSELLG